MTTKKETEERDKRIQKINHTISDLVYDKIALKKAYNYYHGKMDLDQYKHLEENYGIGTPTQIKFIPLIKKHVDALVGHFLDLPLNIQISCKDSNTLSNIFREKQLYIDSQVRDIYIKDLQNQILTKFGLQGTPPTDPLTEEYLNNLVNDLNKNFISEYEITAQNLITYLSQSRNIDLRTKSRILFTDLLITGTAYYKEYPSESGDNIELETLNPINTFIERNPNSYYLKDSPRAVCRYYMTPEQILHKYHKELDDESRKKLEEGLIRHGSQDGQVYVIRSTGPVSAVTDNNTELGTGVLGGLEVSPTWDGNYSIYTASRRDIVVHEIEYIDTDEHGVEHRYSDAKIGEDIYIIRKKDINVIRSVDNKKHCTLSINGVFMTTRQNQPFSLVLATADLQDMYNILHFHRENLIANSGSKGGYIDVSKIPTWLDEDETMRLLKFVGYKKQGFAPLDFSQIEPGVAPVNTIYNGYDDTVPLNAIQAIDISLERVELSASSITGVFREMIGGIEQKDAVHNVKVGMEQSFIITKSYFANMNLILKELMLDALNLGKIVYKDGLTGAIILGDKGQKIFTALPEYYTLTDFDIHIADGQEAVRDMESIRELNLELVKAGQVDAEVVLSTVGCKSLTDYKQKSLEAIKRRKEEAGQMQQMQQNLEQSDQVIKELQQQLQQMQQQLQQAQQQLQQAQDNSEKNKIEWAKVKSQDEFNKSKIEVDNKKVDLELAQMFDNNPHNNEVKY
jgi:hypothetical protein